jgi:hypothetical protein
VKDAFAYCGAVAVSLVIVAGCAYVLMLARWGREP